MGEESVSKRQAAAFYAALLRVAAPGQEFAMGDFWRAMVLMIPTCGTRQSCQNYTWLMEQAGYIEHIVERPGPGGSRVRLLGAAPAAAVEEESPPVLAAVP